VIDSSRARHKACYGAEPMVRIHLPPARSQERRRRRVRAPNVHPYATGQLPTPGAQASRVAHKRYEIDQSAAARRGRRRDLLPLALLLLSIFSPVHPVTRQVCID